MSADLSLKIQATCPARPGLAACPWTDMQNAPTFTSYTDAQQWLKAVHGVDEMQRVGWSFRIAPSDFESAAVSVEDDCA